MNRRKVLIASLGGLTGIAFARKAGSCRALRVGLFAPDDIGFALSRLFPDPNDAKFIGNCYLAQCPKAVDRNAIIDDLELPLHGLHAYERSSLKSWVAEAQRRDFTAGNIVVVDRWILSHTEARLCALIALA